MSSSVTELHAGFRLACWAEPMAIIDVETTSEQLQRGEGRSRLGLASTGALAIRP
jgi:hypothetical protein